MMKVIDIEGKKIEVTDLQKALLQAEDFAGYSHSNGEVLTGFFKERSLYWKDLFAKLQELNRKLGKE